MTNNPYEPPEQSDSQTTTVNTRGRAIRDTLVNGLAISLLLAVCFASSVQNPFTTVPHGIARLISYGAAFAFSLINAFVIFAGFKGRNLLASRNPEISPGQFIVVGFACRAIYEILFDTAFGYSFYSNGGSNSTTAALNASSALIANGLPVIPLWLGFYRGVFGNGWKYVALSGAILFALSAFVGSFELIEYLLTDRPKLGELSFVNSSDFKVMMMQSTMCINLAFICWGIALTVLYMRDYLKHVRYNWIHYVPIVKLYAGFLIGVGAQIAILAVGSR